MTSSNGNIFRVTGNLRGEFTGHNPVTRSFDVFFDLGLNKRLSKQWRGWIFETLSRPFWRHCNAEYGKSIHQQIIGCHKEGYQHIVPSQLWETIEHTNFVSFLKIIRHILGLIFECLRTKYLQDVFCAFNTITSICPSYILTLQFYVEMRMVAFKVIHISNDSDVECYFFSLDNLVVKLAQIEKFMGPTWDQGADGIFQLGHYNTA